MSSVSGSLPTTSPHYDVEKHAQDPLHDPLEQGHLPLHHEHHPIHHDSASTVVGGAPAAPAWSFARPKYANPSPLGLFSFANTTLLISFCNANTRGVSHPNIVFGMALCVGGLAQFVSGILEFWTGNSFALTVCCSFGGYWMALGLMYWPSSGILAAYESEEELNNALGLFMFVWMVFTVLMAVGALHCSLGLFLVLGGLALIYLLSGIGFMLDQRALHRASGAVGVATAFTAYYTAAGDLYKSHGMKFSLFNPALFKKSE